MERFCSLCRFCGVKSSEQFLFIRLQRRRGRTHYEALFQIRNRNRLYCACHQSSVVPVFFFADIAAGRHRLEYALTLLDLFWCGCAEFNIPRLGFVWRYLQGAYDRRHETLCVRAGDGHCKTEALHYVFRQYFVTASKLLSHFSACLFYQRESGCLVCDCRSGCKYRDGTVFDVAVAEKDCYKIS